MTKQQLRRLGVLPYESTPNSRTIVIQGTPWDTGEVLIPIVRRPIPRIELQGTDEINPIRFEHHNPNAEPWFPVGYRGHVRFNPPVVNAPNVPDLNYEIERVTVSDVPSRRLRANWTMEPAEELRNIYDVPMTGELIQQQIRRRLEQQEFEARIANVSNEIHEMSNEEIQEILSRSATIGEQQNDE